MINTVIFDMDGLLIDSEPIWHEATNEIFATKGFQINYEQYATSTGLRTAEFLEHWFHYFNIDFALLNKWEEWLFELVIAKVLAKGKQMEGVNEVIELFMAQNFKIGLASSSPISLINAVVDKLKLQNKLSAIASAQHLAYGKPHPEVYLNCATMLGSKEFECICFEDSVNGMIAAKAAKMKCVVVPASHQINEAKWTIADLKIKTLLDFDIEKLHKINHTI